jgi:hypothetical protein
MAARATASPYLSSIAKRSSYAPYSWRKPRPGKSGLSASLGPLFATPPSFTGNSGANITSKSASYSPFGKKWGPGKADTPDSDPLSAGSTSKAPASVAGKPITNTTAKPATYSAFGKKWGPSQPVALTLTASLIEKPASDSSFENRMTIPEGEGGGATGAALVTVASTSPASVAGKPMANGTAKPASYSAFGRKWGRSKTDSPATDAPTPGTSTKRTSFSPFGKKKSGVDGGSDAPASAAPVTVTSTFPASVAGKAMAKAMASGAAKPTSYSVFGKTWGRSKADSSASVPPTSSTSTKRASFSPFGKKKSSVDRGPVSTASGTSMPPTSATGKPVAGSTAKPANYSVYGKKWGPSKADSPASTPPATDSSAERAIFSPFDERDSIVGGSDGAPAIANPSTPPSSDTGKSMASAIAEPENYSAYGKKWVPSETDAPPSIDSPLAEWRRNRIQIGPMVDSDRPDGSPASEDSVTSTSPSSEESMASATAEPESNSAHGEEWAPSETDAPTTTSSSPLEMEKETSSSPFEMNKESNSDTADSAPAAAGATTATIISVPEKPVTKVAKKPENYSPYGKKWGSNSANDLKQREEESRKEREKVRSPAGRALNTLKRLFSK